MAQKSNALVPQKPFRTATWNMYTFTPIKQSEPALVATKEWGTQLIFGQESGNTDRDKLFERNGFETHAYRQYRFSFDPARFKLVTKWERKLSNQAFFEKGGDKEQYSYGLGVLLEDLDTGLTLEAWTYHPPAHVQKDQQGPGYTMRRYLALIETMQFLALRAETTEADAFLAAGDDNWDEDADGDGGGRFPTKDVDPILLGKLTGLVEIQAGEPTFGNREIDDYRVRSLDLNGRLAATGKVRVSPGFGAEKPAHKLHEREWTMLVEKAPLLSPRKVALEVIDGKWGVGEDRKARLIAAGYDYDVVQAKVVKLLTPPEPEPIQHPCLACGNVHMGVVKTPSR